MTEIGKTYRHTKSGKIGVALAQVVDPEGRAIVNNGVNTELLPVSLTQLQLLPNHIDNTSGHDMRWFPDDHLEEVAT